MLIFGKDQFIKFCITMSYAMLIFGKDHLIKFCVRTF